jgi:hypothetical protein
VQLERPLGLLHPPLVVVIFLYVGAHELTGVSLSWWWAVLLVAGRKKPSSSIRLI